jgi:hypothetical protein
MAEREANGVQGGSTMLRLRDVLLVATVALTACGGNSTPSVPTPTQASITLTVAPNPVTSVACNPGCISSNGTSFPFQFSVTVNIQETAGIGGNVDFVNFFGQHGSRTYGTVNFGSDIVIQREGTNHISGRGTLSFPFTIDYNNGDGTHDLLGNLSVQFSDDRGNRIIASGQFNVI